MRRFLIIGAGLILIISPVIWGCGLQGEGTLTVNLTDAPGDYDSVVIEFAHIAVHNSYSVEPEDPTWIVLGPPADNPTQTYDLLTLQNGKLDLLSQHTLSAGKYTQIRIAITDAYIVKDGVQHDLIVPSGYSSGVKFTHVFWVYGDKETLLEVDFDAGTSIKDNGDGSYSLNPQIKITEKLPPICYPDLDGDGYGDENALPYLSTDEQEVCIEDDTDCDDTDPLVYPGNGCP